MNVIFETEHLLIREFEIEDATYLCELDSNPLVMKHISKDIKHFLPLEYGLEKVKKQILRYKQNDGLGVWVVIQKETFEFMGWVCLNELDSSHLIEIGYRYLPSYWGKGYGSEVAKVVLNYGLNTLELNRVVAIAMKDNKASRRIIEKIGMSYVGIRNFYGKDVVLYEKYRTQN